MNALTYGVDPIRAAGFSAATWFVLLAELTFSLCGYRSLGNVPRVYLSFLAIALTCSVVFLTDKPGQHELSCAVGDTPSISGWSREEDFDQHIVWKHEDISAHAPKR